MKSKWASAFVKDLAAVSLPNVFNPYNAVCDTWDHVRSPAMRREALVSLLSAYEAAGVQSIWFGRDFGYRGGRRTGQSLTDEAHLPELGRLLLGRPILKATTGPVVAERTATVVWGVIRQMARPPLLWNAFPLHPHSESNPFTNRAHTASERRVTAWTIHALVEKLRPKRLVAIGNDAAKALADLGLAFDLVRHPSYGGQRDFIAGMGRLHGHCQQNAEAYDLFSARIPEGPLQI